jgi:hypothetical protein
MPLRGRGALVIWRSVTPEADEDALRWHNTEHMAERCAVPGFLRGRRYVSVSAPKHYVDFYETETSETIRSAPYLARLNDPTPWTRRVLPHFRGTFRIGCRVVASTGRGLGGALLTGRLRPVEGRGDPLRGWLAGPAIEAMQAPAGVVGMHVLETAPETTRVPTAEGRLKGGELAPAEDPWPLILLVECTDAEVAESLPHGLLQPDRLVEAGAEPGTTVYGAYRLQLTMDPET